MAFDPNVATARYIDSLGPAALQKAHDYTVGREWMTLWALVVAALVTWLIVKSGLLDQLDLRFAQERRNLRSFVLALVYFIVSALLTLPWTLYADYFREKSYGRTSQPLGDWLMQQTIALVITALIGALFMMGIYWLMRRTGKRWWIWSGALTAVGFSFVILLCAGPHRAFVQQIYGRYRRGRFAMRLCRWRSVQASHRTRSTCSTARASRTTLPPMPAALEAPHGSQSPMSRSRMRRWTRSVPLPGMRSAIMC